MLLSKPTEVTPVLAGMCSSSYSMAVEERGPCALRSAFKRISSSGRPEIVLVTTSSGMGKSYFVHSTMSKLTQSASDRDLFRALTVTGKCNEINRNQPLSCLIDAVAMICDRIKDMNLPDDTLREFKSAITKAVGSDGRVLTDLIPKLKEVIGNLSPVIELTGKNSRRRLHYLFRCFFRGTTSFFPLVVHLDDMQWVDEASLDLIRYIATDSKLKGFLFICTFRNDVLEKGRKLENYFSKLNRVYSVPVTRSPVGPLRMIQVARLIMTNFDWELDQAKVVAHFVHTHTKGNALFVIRLLKYCQKMNLVKLSPATLRWEWNESAVMESNFPASLGDIFSHEISLLPPVVLDFLKRAALLGFYFDNFALKQVISKANIMDSLKNIAPFKLPDIFTDSLRVAVELGYLQKFGSLGYQFCHDKIWEAFYEAIPTEERSLLHLEVGRALVYNGTGQRRSSATSLDDSFGSLDCSRRDSYRHSFGIMDRHLCLTVDQFNRGRHLIKEANERSELIMLNLRAAALSVASSADTSAISYLKIGIDLLDKDNWEHQYEYSLQLHNALAEAALSSGKHETVQYCLDVVKKHGRSTEDMYNTNMMSIKSLKVQEKLDEALVHAQDFLSVLGVNAKFLRLSKLDLTMNSLKLKHALRNHDKHTLAELPLVNDERKIMVMKIYDELFRMAYSTNSTLFRSIAEAMTKYSLSHGVCGETIGALLALAQMNVIPEKNHNLSQAGIQLMERLEAKEKGPQVKLLVHGYVRPWTSSLRLSLDELSEGQRLGVQVGDIEHATHCGMLVCLYSFMSGENLPDVETKMRAFIDWTLDFGVNENIKFGVLPFLQSVMCLQGYTSQPWQLSGKELDLSNFHARARDCNVTSCSFDLCRLELFCLFHKYEEAGNLLKSVKDFNIHPGHFSSLRFAYYEFVVSIELALSTKSSYWGSRASDAKKKLSEWANTGNVNCRHIFPLLKAETARKERRIVLAKLWFEELINLDDDGSFPQDRAYAHERAGIFFTEVGEKRLASRCFLRANTLYKEWGAMSKLNHKARRASD